MTHHPKVQENHLVRRHDSFFLPFQRVIDPAEDTDALLDLKWLWAVGLIREDMQEKIARMWISVKEAIFKDLFHKVFD